MGTVAGAQNILAALKGAGIDWERVRFEIFKDWPILQLWIWDKGEGEAQVQALRWFVFDATKGDLHKLAEGVVRRRRQKPVPPEGIPVDKAPKKPKYILDGMEKHALKARKDGKLEWSLGREHKVLERKDGH